VSIDTSIHNTNPPKPRIQVRQCNMVNSSNQLLRFETTCANKDAFKIGQLIILNALLVKLVDVSNPWTTDFKSLQFLDAQT